MSLPTIENFEQSKILINRIEAVKFKNSVDLISIYNYDQISFWEVFKPLLNIYVLPGINSKNNQYGFIATFLKIFKNKFYKEKLQSKNAIIDSSYFDAVLLGFSNYISKDIFDPIIYEFNSSNYNNNKILQLNANENIYEKNKFNIHDIWSEKLQNFYKLEIKKIKNKSNLFLIFRNLKYLRQNNISIKVFILIHLYIKYIYIEKYFKYYILAKYFVTSNKIKNFIDIDISDPRSRIFSLVGLKYNIPTITLQFGFYNKDSYEWHYVISTKILVWGDWFKDLFVNYYNIENKKIEIVGSPRFDTIIQNKINHNDNLKNKSVLIISSYEIKGYSKITKTIEFKIYLKSVIDLLLKLNYKIYIKIHPLENNTNYLKNYNTNKLQVININELNDIIKNVDFVLTHGSSLTFNALLLNKPILYPIGKNIVWWDDIFADENFGVGFKDLIHLENILQNIENGNYHFKNDYQEKLKRYIDFETNSSQKIIKYILKN